MVQNSTRIRSWQPFLLLVPFILPLGSMIFDEFEMERFQGTSVCGVLDESIDRNRRLVCFSTVEGSIYIVCFASFGLGFVRTRPHTEK